jgi:hypothetical protein
MASAHLKERIEHLMNYESLRLRAFSHRAVTAFSVLVVSVFVAAAGVVTAQPTVTVPSEDGPYRLNYSVQRVTETRLVFRIQVSDAKTNEVVTAPQVTTELGRPALVTSSADDSGPQWTIRLLSRPDGSGSVAMSVTEGGREIQSMDHEFPAQAVQPRTAAYTGEPLSLNLSNADIRDVLKTFGELTGIEMVVPPEVKGTVTIKSNGRPWDEVLDQMLRENGLAYRIVDGKMEIYPAAR